MTDKERFLSELKLLCNKYAVTLGKSKHYRSVCGEQVLLRTSPAFISKEFERDSILLDLIDDLLLENEYGKVDTRTLRLGIKKQQDDGKTNGI
jgi:hypothetical protein